MSTRDSKVKNQLTGGSTSMHCSSVPWSIREFSKLW